ncbi:PDF receptor isoform X2 [Drosophila hydei]|uniref:PDF receptor isoform X2 n=1 Tax=Drosophila hydei TaxID=7224 RepID=A0A6J2SV66_DROHY|nr:PDF receptor isoform X2 [Drosophila hydei]
MQLAGDNEAGSMPTIRTTTTSSNSFSQGIARKAAVTAATTSKARLISIVEAESPLGGDVRLPSMENSTAMTTTAITTAATATATDLSPTRVLSTSIEATTAVGMDTIKAATESGLTTASSTSIPAWNSSFNSASANNYDNCSAMFANYTQPQTVIYCNWTWDSLLCWPPTPAGVLARMNCPAGYHGVDTRKFANRKCELDGHWGGRPNETEPSPAGWTDYGPCYKPEVIKLMQEIKDVNLYIDIAQRTRTLEIIGLCLSLLALIISLVIFCAFRSLRNNRTKIHKNLFIAMVLQVIVRLTLYLDQFRRGKPEAATNTSLSAIENTPYLCEASYVLLEYARTAMFMWMFIEGLYLHNMVTVAVFQGSFPLIFFSLLGWGMPVVMTFVWVQCTAIFMDTALGDCMWNYNLTPYYWILEGPRLAVILLNFFFLVNIIRVLVVKLRQSQASDIEQTRKAVRAAIVLLPLLGITNLLHLVPALKTAWKFAIWSYVTHFLTSFQGFFIALIYCFLNGEVRAVLLKSLAVWMSVRGHPEWVPKRASMYSAAYNTAPDTEAPAQQTVDALSSSLRISPQNRRLNSRKASSVIIVIANEPQRQRFVQQRNNNNTANSNQGKDEPASGSARIRGKEAPDARNNGNWKFSLCFRGQKVLRVPPASSVPPETNV